VWVREDMKSADKSAAARATRRNSIHATRRRRNSRGRLRSPLPRRCVPGIGVIRGRINVKDPRPGRSRFHSPTSKDRRSFRTVLGRRVTRPRSPSTGAFCGRRSTVDGSSCSYRRRSARPRGNSKATRLWNPARHRLGHVRGLHVGTSISTVETVAPSNTTGRRPLGRRPCTRSPPPVLRPTR